MKDNTHPQIELLTSDLDLGIVFVPGHDLLVQSSATTSDSVIAAVALALWELTGSESNQQSPSTWVLNYYERIGQGEIL